MDPYSTTPQDDADDTQVPAAGADEAQTEGVELPEVEAAPEMGEASEGATDAPVEVPSTDEVAPEASSESVEAAPAEAEPAEESSEDAA